MPTDPEEFMKSRQGTVDPEAFMASRATTPSNATTAERDQPFTAGGVIRAMPHALGDLAAGATRGALKLPGIRHPAFVDQPAANTAQQIGEVLPLVAGVVAPAKAGISALSSRFLRADPAMAFNRAMRLTRMEPRIPEALSAIKGANPGFEPAVEEGGKLNVIPAARKALQVHEDALQPWMQRMAGTKVSGQPIVEATRQAIQKMLPSERAGAQALVEHAARDYGDMTPEQLRDRLELLNNRLSPFYNKSEAAKSTVLADIPEAVLKAQRDAAADTLYQHLDPEHGGAGPRAIQMGKHDILNVLGAAAKREAGIAREQPLSRFGAAVEPLKNVVRGVIPRVAMPAAVEDFLRPAGRSLPNLRKAFGAVSETEGANKLGELPRPGPRMIAGPVDTSGALPRAVADFRSVGATNPIASRALLPGASPGQKAPLITPPPADTSGSIPNRPPNVRGYPAGISQRLLPEAKTLPQGGFATGTTNELVPFKHPVTGKIEYVPKWMLQGLGE